MENPEKINQNAQILHNKLYEFIKESIPLLRKCIQINSIPTEFKYEISEVDKKIVKNRCPNWWHLSLDPILNLPSLNDAIKTCNEYEQFISCNGMIAYIFDSGIYFNSNEIPTLFLQQLINRENGFRFRKKTFEEIFSNLLKFTSSEKPLCRIVVPLDNFSMKPKSIKLDDNIRLRRLTSPELVDLINHRPILGYFYGSKSLQLFNTVLEIDSPSNFIWFNQQDIGSPNIFKHTDEQNQIKSKINQEITILRTYFKKQISPNIFVIDYSGWNSDLYSGGVIGNLPWVKPLFCIQNPYRLKEMNRFRIFRNKFLTIKNKQIQQQIYVAMRKLAFCMDRPYKADRIMDCVAGLEGLLVDEKNEITHKFAERISILLETNPSKRADLLKEMKDAYTLRSDIAHGSNVADDFDTIFSLGKLPKKKDIEKYNKIQKLEPKVMHLLYSAILICIDKQTTHFNWDSSLMGTKVKPFLNLEK